MTKETWYYWLDATHSPPLNMALDEALLAEAARRNICIVRFYSWDRPAISIGYLQNHTAGERDGFEVVRRPTGGGVVFHDHDLTYTVTIPAGHWISEVDRETSYGYINRAVTAGLNRCNLGADLTDTQIPASVERRTMACFTNPTKYDIVLEGAKVAGSAQRRVREGILHQGSIHFGGPLPLPRQQLITEIIQGFRDELEIRMAQYSLPTAIFDNARRIAAEKYATTTWNHKR